MLERIGLGLRAAGRLTSHWQGNRAKTTPQICGSVTVSLLPNYSNLTYLTIQHITDRLANFTNPLVRSNPRRGKNVKPKAKPLKAQRSLVKLMDLPVDLFLEVPRLQSNAAKRINDGYMMRLRPIWNPLTFFTLPVYQNTFAPYSTPRIRAMCGLQRGEIF